jgi:hypothetical protein
MATIRLRQPDADAPVVQGRSVPSPIPLLDLWPARLIRALALFLLESTNRNGLFLLESTN